MRRATLVSTLASAALLAAALVAAPRPAHAVPSTMTFTGRLLQAGQPVTGNHDLVVRLYPTQSGGTPIWEESHPGTLASNGLVFLQLGAGTTLDDGIFDGGDLFVEISIDGTPMLPRAPISTVPYAHRAGVAERLGELGEADVQRRVTGSCLAGQAIRAIAADGTVTCEADDDAGGDITGITTAAGSGLLGGVASGAANLSVDTNVIQKRVSATCPAGQAIRAIAADGTVTCEVDDDSAADPGNVAGVVANINNAPTKLITNSSGGSFQSADVLSFQVTLPAPGQVVIVASGEAFWENASSTNTNGEFGVILCLASASTNAKCSGAVGAGGNQVNMHYSSSGGGLHSHNWATNGMLNLPAGTTTIYLQAHAGPGGDSFSFARTRIQAMYFKN
jgi:hypothetical protein